MYSHILSAILVHDTPVKGILEVNLSEELRIPWDCSGEILPCGVVHRPFTIDVGNAFVDPTEVVQKAYQVQIRALELPTKLGFREAG